MATMALTQGKATQIDDADLGNVSRRKWTYLPNGRSGYAVRWERQAGQRRTVYLHREIMGAAPGQVVDHIDGNGLDNRRSNLRLCNQVQNTANRAAPVRTIPYRGVYAETRAGRRPYFAQIKAFRKCWRLGSFSEQEAAARAYDRAALHFFGSFARLNFPDDIAATRALPLAGAVARRFNQQLAFDFDVEPWPADFEFPAPTLTRPGWAEFQRVRIAGAALTEDWDEGLL